MDRYLCSGIHTHTVNLQSCFVNHIFFVFFVGSTVLVDLFTTVLNQFGTCLIFLHAPSVDREDNPNFP